MMIADLEVLSMPFEMEFPDEDFRECGLCWESRGLGA